MTVLGANWTAKPAAGSLNPVTQTFWLLRLGFTAAPILFGLDKFTNLMVDWSIYLAPWLDDLIPGSADEFMMLIGVVEIAAGLLVAIKPSIGGLVVAGWLAGIITNLLSIPGYYDIALRDFGLLLAALGLARLARHVEREQEGE
jgi:hypothetical protein